MKILEIKNNLVKISYDVNDNLALSGFAVIEDTNCPYVAQIINLKADGGNNYAILKLLFTFDESGILKSYNGTIPSDNAEITPLPVDEILNLFQADSPIFIGNVAHSGNPLNIDLEVFTNGLLICSNNLINTGKLLANLFPQIVKRNKKVILLDTTGDYYTENSFVFGKNFKLPLNSEFLDYIFDNDLEGVEPVSKAVIQDIFSEVKEYLSTIPQGYLPIDMLINVVQEQYNETGIPELVLLKNKLIRYKESNVFASGNDDIFMLRSKIVHTDSLIVDVSQTDNKLIRKLIGFVYDTVSTVDADSCIFASLNNDFTDKKLLRKTMEFGNIYTTFICSHEFKYLADLKQIIPNMIFFAPQTTQHDFAGYNTFLGKLNSEEFVIYGEFTQKIPFIVQLSQYNEDTNFVTADSEVKEDGDSELESEDKEPSDISDFNDNELEFDSEYKEELTDADEVIEPETTETELSEDTEELDYASTDIDADDNEPETVSTEENSGDDDFFQQSPQMNVSEEASFENSVLSDREILEEQVANDVNASFYKKIEEENLDDENKIKPEVLTEDVQITDEDLDFIETINLNSNSEKDVKDSDELEIVESLENDNEPEVDSENIELEEQEEDKAESTTIPIYTPEEFVKEDSATEEQAPMFKTGDVISHPKYGQGVVEKMINYGNKTLCSINFVNLGRRLLDPTISDLELVGREGALVE